MIIELIFSLCWTFGMLCVGFILGYAFRRDVVEPYMKRRQKFEVMFRPINKEKQNENQMLESSFKKVGRWLFHNSGRKGLYQAHGK